MPTIPDEKGTEAFTVEFSTNGLRSENPAAYFDAVAQVLDAFQLLDANLLNSILPQSRTRLSIERIEVASLKLWLAAQLEDLPEEDLRGIDFRRLGGHFLVKARNAFVRFLRKTPKVSDKKQIEELGQEIDALAKEVVPNPKRFSRRLIIVILVRTIRATQSVPGNETVAVTIANETNVLPREAEITSAVAQEVAEAEIEPFEQEMKLLVKKPDMLGQSQWEFIDRGRIIRAKMNDTGWLEQYQHQEVALKPGDAIEAKVRLTPRSSTGVEDYSYDVIAVRRVIPSSVVQQPILFTDISGDK